VNFAEQHNTTYKMLRVLNPWILNDNLVVPKAKAGDTQKSYRIAIPLDEEGGDHGSELTPYNKYDSLAVDTLMPSPKELPSGKENKEAKAGGLPK
jgi:hypothetical protein